MNGVQGESKNKQRKEENRGRSIDSNLFVLNSDF